MYYNLRFGFVFFVYDIDKKVNRIELLIIKKICLLSYKTFTDTSIRTHNMARSIFLNDFGVATVLFLSALSFSQTSETFSTDMTGEQDMSERDENVQDGMCKYVMMAVQSHRHSHRTFEPHTL